MPRIPDDILDSIVYLYPTLDAAQRSERAGGCGFVVSVPSEADTDLYFTYVVTNSHVIREGKSTVVRLNTRDGGMSAKTGTENGWIHHPDGDDIAILPVNFEYETIKAKAIPEYEWFVTKDWISYYDIGIGDEALLLGRFVSHEGKTRNMPAARFGHIAMMPQEPIRTARGLLQEVFLVECRSLPGYSGSPVFSIPLPLSAMRAAKGRTVPSPKLLGIDMGHLLDEMPVLNKSELAQGNHVKIDDNWAVQANTGMSCVIPAWKIREVLYMEEVVKIRKELDEELHKAKTSSPVLFDAATSEKPVFTRGKFEDGLRKVSRKKLSKNH